MDGQNSSADRTAALSSAPEIDQKNHQKRGQNEPRDHHDFHPQVANRWNVVVHIRILVKKSMAVEKDVRASNQIDDEEECRGDSERRKSYGINSEYIMYRRDHFQSHSGLLEPRGTSTVR